MKFKRVTLALLGLTIVFGLLFRDKILGEFPRLSYAFCHLTDKKEGTCWESVIKQSLFVGGPKTAFSALKYLYEEEPEIRAECHDYAHYIGESSYELYKKSGAIGLAPEASYCGYGFYHGFIIAMMADGKEPFEVSRFCEDANSELSKDNPITRLDCYHGIGHGVTDYDFRNIPKIETAQILIESSTNLCKDVAPGEEELAWCADGVFHSVTEVPLQDLPKFIDKNAPLSFCEAQEKDFQGACYESLGFLLMQLTNNDFAEALSYSKGVDNPLYKANMIRLLSGYQAYRTASDPDYIEDISSCRSLGSILFEECLKGLVEGSLDFGNPGDEYAALAKLCASEELSSQETDFCLSHAASHLGGTLGETKRDEFCDLMTVEKRGKLCQ